jgi:hypothetical protein
MSVLGAIHDLDSAGTPAVVGGRGPTSDDDHGAHDRKELDVSPNSELQTPSASTDTHAGHSVAFDIDVACDLILDRGRESLTGLTSVRVSPAVYDAMIATRPDEIARGNPLLIFGLSVEADDQVQAEHPVLR